VQCVESQTIVGPDHQQLAVCLLVRPLGCLPLSTSGVLLQYSRLY
jgi:hypothetical protein